MDGVPETLSTDCSLCSGCTACPGATPFSYSQLGFTLSTACDRNNTPQGHYAGQMDEVRVWSRALPQNEIQASKDFQLTSGYGLIGRWGLNEGSGSIAGDSISPTYNGSISGGATWITSGLPNLPGQGCQHDPIPGCCLTAADCVDTDICTEDMCIDHVCRHTPGNAGVVCRASAGVCDLPDVCNGVNVGCPADIKSAAICRPAVGQCDAAESCDGLHDDCPPDSPRPNGAPCEDGSVCTAGDSCQTGVCVSGAPVCTPFVDTTTSDFGAGGTGDCSYVSATGDGEVILAPSLGEEFSGSHLPAGWAAYPWATGGTSQVVDGRLVVDGARVVSTSTQGFGPGTSMEFVANFAAASVQYVGLGAGPPSVAFSYPPVVAFVKDSSSASLYAHVWNSGSWPIDVTISNALLGASHRYRIDWRAEGVEFFVDGILAASQALAITAPMRPFISDYDVGGESLSADWIRLSPYASSCVFESRVIDGGATAVHWRDLFWVGGTPVGTSVAFETRTGNTPAPDTTWSPYVQFAGTAIPSSDGHYLQYRAILATADPHVTPELDQVTVTADLCSPEICDGLDNDCNGLVDDLAGPPGRVRELRVEADKETLQWVANSGPIVWDVLKGDINRLVAGSGFETSLLACVESDSPDPHATDTAIPPAGDGSYYLVRAIGCGSAGSWNDGTEVTSRDAGINGSPGACP